MSIKITILILISLLVSGCGQFVPSPAVIPVEFSGGAGTSDEDKIRKFQEDYFAKHGTYFQILEDKKIPSDLNEDITLTPRNLNVQKKFEVHTYKNPDGTQGYNIIWLPEPQINDGGTASSTNEL